MTECPICFDAIDADTGSVVMSCKHSFHLGCITEWLARSQSCPCCRKKPSEKERVKGSAPRSSALWNELYGNLVENTYINRFGGGTGGHTTRANGANSSIDNMISNIQNFTYHYYMTNRTTPISSINVQIDTYQTAHTSR